MLKHLLLLHSFTSLIYVSKHEIIAVKKGVDCNCGVENIKLRDQQ